MSQTVAVAPTGASSGLDPTQPSTVSSRLASAAETIRHWLDGTPGRLRVAAAIAVLASLIVAFGGGAALRERSAALAEANRSAAHLVLVQGVETQLVEADADVTNAFLGFGLEPVDRQQDYVASIQQASHDLALASNESAQDAQSLGAANAALTRYTGYIGSARANNRQGKPVGANYLRTASDLLSTAVLQPLQARAAADQAKIDAAYSRATHASAWLAVAALLGLGGLIGVQIYVARRSRRILNVPLAGATGGLVLVLVIAGGVMALAQSRASEVRDGALTNAKFLSLSRVAAFQAKSNEALTLIQRGSATTADKVWTDDIRSATSALGNGHGPTEAASALADYANKHRQLNAADVGGAWKSAVTAAIDSRSGSANQRFVAYATSSEKALQAQASATTEGLDQAGNLLLPIGILLVLAGLLAAAGAWWGLSLRLDEYR